MYKTVFTVIAAIFLYGLFCCQDISCFKKVRYFFVIPQSILHRGVIMKPPGWKSTIPRAAVGFFF